MAFVTTDDFYGMYTAYETKEHLQSKELIGKDGDYYRWEPNKRGVSSNEDNDIFYESIVKIVDSELEIALTRSSVEKWMFALSFIDA
ncbi:hypothetical protein [Candidatus Enterococcus mansonii]|uniref:Uncharacterized protein n=1 Tax=Candidatus Enterococcus mansonii TaxID=1834181 RepID=A0A242CH23_9ENTE|nr:hypothetical protein [Enterococcus sp. 4G2_DIV0659]OTO09516.1 hypothetical protein A5880_000195 [Enterococcus sp. 4G2_DIV0659]